MQTTNPKNWGSPLQKYVDELFHDSENLPKVYLAGTIRAGCWRHNLIPELGNYHWSIGTLTQDKFIYIGPFFAGYDHAYYHSANTHGNGNGCSPDLDIERRIEARLCRQAVDKADLVYCYIDAAPCYGTIAEIERAHIQGTRVVIAFAPGLASPENNDLWFVCEGAYNVYYDVYEYQLKKLLNDALRWLP